MGRSARGKICIERLLQSGATAADAAAESGLSLGYVYQIARSLGVKPPLRSTAAAEAVLAALRADPDVPYAALAARHGFTAEWVRRIARRRLGEAGWQRKRRAAAVRAGRRRIPPKRFIRLVRHWLLGIGAGYCSRCHHCAPLGQFDARRYECRLCVSERSAAYYLAHREWKKAREARAAKECR